MSRFNLLLLSQDIYAGHAIVKAAYKVYKRNFVFEVDSTEDATRLTQKLKIDLIVIDFDQFNEGVAQLIAKNPRVPIIGIYTKMDVDFTFNADRINLLSKVELFSDLLFELKSLKKGQAERQAKPAKTRYGNPSFRDYFTLTTAR